MLPAIGINTSILPTSAVEESGAFSPSFNQVMSSNFAMAFKKLVLASRRRWSSALPFLNKHLTGLPGPIPRSARMLRIPVITPFSHSMSVSACASTLLSSNLGYWANMMVSPFCESLVVSAIGASVCQISSVMYGIIGCAKRRMVSNTSTSVRRAARFCASVDSSLHSTGLESSRYQAQYSSHTNSYNDFAA